MDVRDGLWRRLSTEELMLLKCGVGEDSWESLGLQPVHPEIQPVHPKGDHSWVFIGRTDVEAETPILWPPDMKSWLIWRDSDAGTDSGQEEKRMTEDEMVGWHHLLHGHRCGWTLGIGDGQGGLACCGSWSHKELDMTELLNWTELNLWPGCNSGVLWRTSSFWSSMEGTVKGQISWKINSSSYICWVVRSLSWQLQRQTGRYESQLLRVEIHE